MTKKKREPLGYEPITINQLIDWARGQVLVSIGKGDYQGAVSMVVFRAIKWADQDRPELNARTAKP